MSFHSKVKKLSLNDSCYPFFSGGLMYHLFIPLISLEIFSGILWRSVKVTQCGEVESGNR